MSFWPVALLIAVAILVSYLNEAFPHALRTEGASEHLLYLALLLIAILIWTFRGRAISLRPAAIASVFWFTAAAALVAAYAYRDEARMALDRIRGEVTPTLAIARQEGMAELRKAWDGHFRAVTELNGRKVGMLVDTGASMVLLTYEDADAAGLAPETLDYTLPVSTANGRAFVAPVTLDSLVIGSVGLSRVKAAVAQPGLLPSSLLGMSFLGRLRETAFRRDTLVLRN